jgi:hypothetical protein
VIKAFLKKQMPHVFAEPYSPHHDEALHLLEARRGRGKSYFLMYYVWCAISQRKPMWCNFTVDIYRLALQAKMAGLFPTVDSAYEWIDDNYHYMKTWDDLLTAFDGYILMDEAARIFDSRNRTAVPSVVLEWSQLSRRSKLTIILASQSFDWLDVRIRQLADTLWMVRKIQPKVKNGVRPPPVGFLAYGLDPWAKGLTENVVRDHADRKMSIPFNLRLAQSYDTREPIAVIGGEPSYKTYGAVFAELVSSGRISPSAASRIVQRTRRGIQRRGAVAAPCPLGLIDLIPADFLPSA